MPAKIRLSTTTHCTRKSTRYNSSAEAISPVSISTSRKPINRSSMETCWNSGVRRTKKTANRALSHRQHRSLCLSESLFSSDRLHSDQKKSDKRRYDERHWTKKNLDEMCDRDWRIFKEDFSITTRGGNIPHPLRSWVEAGLEKSITDVIEAAGYKVDEETGQTNLFERHLSFFTGSNAYSTAGNSHWFAKSRCDGYR
jgi:hypothetical protein